jgi:hypothetical protein
MDEIRRLKLRRHRRQDALQTLVEIDDVLNVLKNSFAELERLQSQPWYFVVCPWLWSRSLAAIAGHARKASLLAEIVNRVETIRAEFHSLRVSDERELQVLESLQQSLKTPTPTR